jgi:protein SCO1/2
MKKPSSWLLVLPSAALLLLAGLSVRPSTAVEPEVGVRDHTGNRVALDLVFRDETGREVRLGGFFHAPVLLVPVYLRCRDVCPLLLNGVADVLNRVPSEPGKDFTVLTVSYDPTDPPDSALAAKRKYLALIQRPFPESAWRFLTGDSASIRTLMDEVGFGYKPDGDGFLHPVVVMVLSPRGKVVRYLYGSDFLPMDLQTSLIQAKYERTGPALARMLSFCFRYEPKGHKLVFNAMKVTGVVTLAFALAVVLFLVFGKRKRPASKESLT